MIEKAVLVGVCLNKKNYAEKEASIAELVRLAKNAKVEVCTKLIQNRENIDPKYFAGKGFLQKTKMILQNIESDLLIFDNDLTPSQARNIERDFELKAIDRTELILNIFHQHAKTKEAKLQVRLAELQYQLPRLKKLWSHLDREKGTVGNVGTARGMGEKQIEIDKRLVRREIEKVKKELEKIDKQTATQRKQRKRFKKVCLVGYTNAGKSTLFNSLTNSNVLVEDKLFATLDSTAAEIKFDKGRKLILSDTVGFISHLPHHLVASFRATLQDVIDADLLLHIVDAADENQSFQIKEVKKVLKEIGAEDIPQILVNNKSDLIDFPKKIAQDQIFISAAKKINLENLKKLIDENLHQAEEIEFFFNYSEQNLVNKLHKLAKVRQENYHNDGIEIKAIVNQEDLRYFEDNKK